MMIYAGVSTPLPVACPSVIYDRLSPQNFPSAFFLDRVASLLPAHSRLSLVVKTIFRKSPADEVVDSYRRLCRETSVD